MMTIATGQQVRMAAQLPAAVSQRRSTVPMGRKTKSAFDRWGPSLVAGILLALGLSGPAVAQRVDSGSLVNYEPEDPMRLPRRSSLLDQVRMADDRTPVPGEAPDVAERPPPGGPTAERAAPDRNVPDQLPQANEELELAPQPFYERFSAYLRQTTGKRLSGRLPFTRVAMNNVRLPDNYRVSTGDQIEIQVWGTVTAQYKVTVDTGGRIFVPEIGSIQVLGVRNAELTPTLETQFKRVYKGFELRAVVSAARSVDVTISGQASTIGQRSIPATVNLIGAALAYTRPAEGGSRRFIELRRGEQTVKIDLYCFSHGRCPTMPTSLQDGDVLYIPARASLAAIAGAVNRPGIYELAPGEGLSDLISYAGGLSVDASAGVLDLFSFQAEEERRRGYVSIAPEAFCPSADKAAPAGCRRLADGDFVDVRPVLNIVRGAVTVTAAGVDPLRFTYRPGIRLLDVVKQPLTRFLSGDVVAGINRGDFRYINELDERLPELDLESVTVYRLNADARGYSSHTVDALAAMREGKDSPYNVELYEGDIVALDTKSAWKTPRSSMTVAVRLLGEVGRPGRYSFKGERSLGELVQQAGGYTGSAAPWAAVVLRSDDPRASINRQQGLTAIRSVYSYQVRQAAVNNPVEAATAQAVTQAAAAATPVVLPPTTQLSRLVGDRTVLYVDSTRNADLKLTPGDIVIVPPQQQTVGCYGAVFRQGEIVLGAAEASSADVRQRCGIVEEMVPAVYHFSVRDGTTCVEGWFNTCPPMRGGDFIVSVPDAIKKRGMAAFLDYVDALYKVALAAATLKVLSQ